MCGIAGYRTQRKVEPLVLPAMVDTLYHRGPDSSGYFHSSLYSAGMRRLAINDLQTGLQPLYNEDKSVVLFYNGEIYNSPFLRQQLESKGYRFRTRSDGEVICHLYCEMGEKLFEILDGMFAVALWIEPEQKLILARDVPGEKPLYYYRISDTEIVFSSEIQSLLRFPGIDTSLDLQALWDFPTFLWIPEPSTVFKEIKALPHSHYMVIDGRGTRLCPYQYRSEKENIELIDDKAATLETLHVVSDAIKSRLLSDVPVGAFLSSGLDSSIVSAVATQYLPKLTTFTVGFENVVDPYHGMADESKHAEAFAKKLGTEHHPVRITAEDFSDLLISYIKHAGQPFSVSSGLGILAVAKAARERNIKVLLSGDGADEAFGGYSWYEHLPSLSGGMSQSESDLEEITMQSHGIPLTERLAKISKYSGIRKAWALHYYASEADKHSIFSPDLRSHAKTSLRYFQAFKPASKWEPIDYIKQDRQFYLPFEMLRKVDRMTMAYSVEGRVPFVAPTVLSHAKKLSYRHLVRNGTLKWVLREAFKKYLPQDVVSRPKHGFNVPIDHWLKTSWMNLVEESFGANSKLVSLGLVQTHSIKTVKKMILDVEKLHGHTVFSFVVLNLWLNQLQEARGQERYLKAS